MQPTGQPQELVDLRHPGTVALGQVVVDGDDMHALARQGVQHDGQRCHQRLALAGLHLGDIAFVQHHAADHLHVVVALTQGAFRGLAHDGEGLVQARVQRLAGGDLGLHFLDPGAHLIVAERGNLRLQRVDGLHPFQVGPYQTVVRGSEYLSGQGADHALDPHARECPRDLAHLSRQRVRRTRNYPADIGGARGTVNAAQVRCPARRPDSAPDRDPIAL